MTFEKYMNILSDQGVRPSTSTRCAEGGATEVGSLMGVVPSLRAKKTSRQAILRVPTEKLEGNVDTSSEAGNTPKREQIERILPRQELKAKNRNYRKGENQ